MGTEPDTPLRGPDVVGLTEAAEILGIRPAMVRQRLDAAGVKHTELAAGAVWHRDVVERARVPDATFARRKAPDVVGLRESAELLGIAPANVRKWMARRELHPRELASGPVWDRRAVEKAEQAWTRRRRPREAA